MQICAGLVMFSQFGMLLFPNIEALQSGVCVQALHLKYHGG